MCVKSATVKGAQVARMCLFTHWVASHRKLGDIRMLKLLKINLYSDQRVWKQLRGLTGAVCVCDVTIINRSTLVLISGTKQGCGILEKPNIAIFCYSALYIAI